MTEQEKMTAGLPYFPGDPNLTAARQRAKELCQQFNQVSVRDPEEGRRLLEQLLGRLGEEVAVNPMFWCDYGFHIRMGSHVEINHNCVILDCAPVTFGDHVLIGPNCGFYTAGHPIDARIRNTGEEFAAPITVGSSVWFGGNVTVLPGVTIGDGSVIGAGSVVTRSIPAGVLAVGNPCRPVRTLGPEGGPVAEKL